MIQNIIAGICAGLCKSFLEHKGKFILWYRDESDPHKFVLGTVLDLLIGGIMGWISTDPLIYSEIFKATDPTIAVSFMFSLFWIQIVQIIATKRGIQSNGGNEIHTNRKKKVLTPLVVMF